MSDLRSEIRDIRDKIKGAHEQVRLIVNDRCDIGAVISDYGLKKIDQLDESCEKLQRRLKLITLQIRLDGIEAEEA